MADEQTNVAKAPARRPRPPAKPNGDQLPAVSPDFFAKMEADQHRQIFAAEELAIPRYVVLQDMSDEVKEREGKYIPGARPGLIFDKIQKTLFQRILFVPVRHKTRYLAWRPRKDGGGLVDQNLSKDEVDANFEKDGPGRWKGMMSVRKKGGDEDERESARVEVIETPEWVGFAIDAASPDIGDAAAWRRCAISFAKSKNKVVRNINSVIELTKLRGKKGPHIPAPYYHRFELFTVLEGSGKDSFFNFEYIHRGWNNDLELVAEAEELWKSIDAGTVSVTPVEDESDV